MTALIIIAAVFGLIALLLLSMIRLHLVSDGDLKVTAGVGFISFPVYPSKEKKKKKSLSQKKYLKLMKEEPEKPEEKEKEKKKDKKEKGGLRETIGFVREVIGRLGEFSRRLHTEIRSLNVSVGGKDAAAAAVTYGAVTQGVSYLIELLDCNTKLKIPDPEKTSVMCDFTSEKFGLDADLMLKIRVFSALKTVIQILIIKMKRDGKKS